MAKIIVSTSHSRTGDNHVKFGNACGAVTSDHLKEGEDCGRIISLELEEVNVSPLIKYVSVGVNFPQMWVCLEGNVEQTV